MEYKNYPNLGEVLREGKSVFEYFDFDPELPPTPTKDVIVLQGSWYEMGVQYGQQARDSLHRRACFFAQLDLAKAGSYEKVYKDLEQYIDHYNQYFPEFVELLHGMADGAELGFYDVAASHTIYTPLKDLCSHVSAWGRATGGEEVIGGANWDYEGNLRVYEPAVVAFPEDDHAFLSASGIATNAMINDAGVMILSSGGQHKLPEDHADIGFQYMVGLLYVAAKCASAAEAKDALANKNIACSIGNNVHIVDESCDAFMLEHTARRNVFRRSGDFSEKDYLLATNHFLAQEMKASLYDGEEEWVDCQYRYDTEEQVIKENFGQVTLDTINAALGCNRTFVNGKWEEEIWSWEKTGGVTRGDWSPENISVTCKNVNRGLIDVKRRELYVIAGCTNLLATERPHATGTAMKLTLKKSPSAVLRAAKTYAQVLLFLAGRDMAETAKALQAEELSAKELVQQQSRMADLNEAKEALYAGHNYANLADCCLDREEKLHLYGLAISRYCYSQCIAQRAMDEPNRIVRGEFEGLDWEEII